MKHVFAWVVLGSLVVGCKAGGDSASGSSGGDAGVGGARAGGVGGVPDAGTSGGPGLFDVTPRDYAASDPGIQYTGRIDFGDPDAPRFSAPGVYIKARFRGDAVTVHLRDQFKDGKRNYYDVFVDDGPAVKLTPERGQTEYPVASDLPYGEHTVTFVKRTEASVGYAEFLGFRFGGEMLAPAPRPTRRLIFVGDSITAGSGVEARNNSAECSEDGWGQPYHNAHLAFGPVAARALGADYHVTAVSGIGLTQNWSTRWDARTMPEVYDLTFVERTDSSPWDHRVFGATDGQPWEALPDGVVIALGTNDFSVGDPSNPPRVDSGGAGGGGAGVSGAAGASGAAGSTGGAGSTGAAGSAGAGSTLGNRVIPTPASFADAYIAFIATLRGYYPDAHFFCVTSPMLGDGYPGPTYEFAQNLKDAIGMVEDHFRSDGRVHGVIVERQFGNGCGKHPDVEEQAEAAHTLTDAIAAAMGW